MGCALHHPRSHKAIASSQDPRTFFRLPPSFRAKTFSYVTQWMLPLNIVQPPGQIPEYNFKHIVNFHRYQKRV